MQSPSVPPFLSSPLHVSLFPFPSVILVPPSLRFLSHLFHCCDRSASQAVSNESQSHHIFHVSMPLYIHSPPILDILSLSHSLSPARSLPLSYYSFCSSLPPAPIFSLAREREGVREGRKEREWNYGEQRGKF